MMSNDAHNGHLPLLTVREVAERLRVDQTTVRRWIAQGVLDAVTLPGSERRKKYRVKQAVFDAIVTVEQEV